MSRTSELVAKHQLMAASPERLQADRPTSEQIEREPQAARS